MMTWKSRMSGCRDQGRWSAPLLTCPARLVVCRDHSEPDPGTRGPLGFPSVPPRLPQVPAVMNHQWCVKSWFLIGMESTWARVLRGFVRLCHSTPLKTEPCRVTRAASIEPERFWRRRSLQTKSQADSDTGTHIARSDRCRTIGHTCGACVSAFLLSERVVRWRIGLPLATCGDRWSERGSGCCN